MKDVVKTLFNSDSDNIFMIQVDDVYNNMKVCDIAHFRKTLADIFKIKQTSLHLVAVDYGSLCILFSFHYDYLLKFQNLSLFQLYMLSHCNVLTLRDTRNRFEYENIQNYKILPFMIHCNQESLLDFWFSEESTFEALDLEISEKQLQTLFDNLLSSGKTTQNIHQLHAILGMKGEDDMKISDELIMVMKQPADQTIQQSLTEGNDKDDIIFQLETELMNLRAEMSEKDEHISTFQLKLTALIQEYKYLSPVKEKKMYQQVSRLQKTELQKPFVVSFHEENQQLKEKQDGVQIPDIHENMYTGILLFERIGSNKWLVRFVIAQNVKILLEYIKVIHPAADQDEIIRFSFLDSVNGYIGFHTDSSMVKGWQVEPHKEPSILRKRDADLFGSEDLPIPPSCLFTVWADSTCNPEIRLRHPVILVGIDSPRKMYISRFLETTVSSLSSDTGMDPLSTVCHCVLGMNDLNEVFMECKNFSNDWKFIGLKLGVRIATLVIIKNDCYDVQQRMLEMLASWLKRTSQKHPAPSWHILLKTLSDFDSIQTTQIASKFVCNHK